MNYSQINSFYKKNIWFLQTNLTLNEKRILKLLKLDKQLDKVTIPNLLERIICNEKRILQLHSIYESFLCHNEIIVSKNELDVLMNKVTHEAMPLALQFSGTKEILRKPLVAIIGSRHPTFYGREQAYRFAKELSAKGCTIISGGAIGIDSIANSVALEHGGGSCAILGSGLKNLYPPSNSFLFKNLVHSKNGLILSEFLESEPPQKWNFPKRNHTIALLADFVLIIEAAFTSGSLITANAALDYGVDVGALPGSVNRDNSEGTNALIQKGAYCIQKPQDVLERVEYVYSRRIPQNTVL